MAQIHPHQYLYFNFLADRKTPERLRARYEMDYWNMALRQSYEYPLRQTPAGAINIEKRYFYAGHRWDIKILPAADRRRLIRDPSRDLDFLLNRDAMWWNRHLPIDSFPPVLHRLKVYNNTIMTVAAPDLARVDPAVAEAYRALHRAATAGEPAARAGGFRRVSAWSATSVGEGSLRTRGTEAQVPAQALSGGGAFSAPSSPRGAGLY